MNHSDSRTYRLRRRTRERLERAAAHLGVNPSRLVTQATEHWLDLLELGHGGPFPPSTATCAAGPVPASLRRPDAPALAT
jgi:hypothetical protein